MKKSILLNLLMMLVVAVSGFLIIAWGLDFYTKHGESVVIPELRGKLLPEGITMLEDADLRYEVVDSIYDKKAVPGSIIEAYPSPGGRVKPQRIIFLKVYAMAPPRIPVPHVKDMSARQALALLRGLGFENIKERSVAGEYIGLCQGITYADGKPLKVGDMISKETPIIMLITGQIQIDSIRLDDLLAEDSLAGVSSAISIGDSTKRKKQDVPEDEPQPEPEQFW